jgi:lysozyme|tara:strand:- start:734 stop:1174 length:441 start_codon:yes stop_codon:yes gene_type:complete
MDRDKLVKELILDEGYIYEIYKDHLGYLTFGVGHLVLNTDKEYGKEVGTPVSEKRILECLNNDVDIVCEELDRNLYWWRELDDNKQRVMVNMCFNLGYPRLSKFKKFLAAMEKHDFETAAIEMMDSKWANQVGLRAERLKKRVLEK